MKKIIFVVLVIGLFLISGCSPKDKTQKDFHKIAEGLGMVSDNIKNDMIGRIRESNESLTLLNENINIKKNQEKTLYYGIRNERESASNFDVEIYCGKGMKGGNGNNIKFDYFGETNIIKKNETEVLPAIIKPNPDTVATTYQCYLNIDSGNYASKVFYVTVT